jgi:hypothetical protein
MRPNRLSLAMLSVAASATVLLATVSPAAADAPPPALLLSRFESIPGNTIDRDGGYSVPIPGGNTSLWLFGDSFWTGGFWFGTTAAVGPHTRGQVPDQLTELTTPPAAAPVPSNRGPSGFLPLFPEGLRTPSGAPCPNQPVPPTNPGDPVKSLPVSWPAGGAAIPNTSRLLISSVDVCVAEDDLLGERFVLTEYTPGTNTLSNRTRVFTNLAGLPKQQELANPIFRGGYLYLFGSDCHEKVFGICQDGSVYLARVSASGSAWRTPANYRWWNGSTWSSDYNAATSILPAAKPSSIVYAGDFSAVGKGFVIIESTSIHGDYTVWRSSSLTGGWTATRSGTTPCSGGGDGANFCRAHIGHPQLSTTSNLLMSYFNPADKHLKVTAVPW